MIRLVVILLLAIVAITVLRMVVGAVAKGLGGLIDPASGNAGAKPAGPGRADGELKRDPVCGTFVSSGSAVTKKVGGEVVYFCSAACRDKYRR